MILLENLNINKNLELKYFDLIILIKIYKFAIKIKVVKKYHA